MADIPRYHHPDHAEFEVLSPDGSIYGHLRIYLQGPAWKPRKGKKWHRAGWDQFAQWLTRNGRKLSQSDLSQEARGRALTREQRRFA